MICSKSPGLNLETNRPLALVQRKRDMLCYWFTQSHGDACIASHSKRQKATSALKQRQTVERVELYVHVCVWCMRDFKHMAGVFIMVCMWVFLCLSVTPFKHLQLLHQFFCFLYTKLTRYTPTVIKLNLGLMYSEYSRLISLNTSIGSVFIYSTRFLPIKQSWFESVTY